MDEIIFETFIKLLLFILVALSVVLPLRIITRFLK